MTRADEALARAAAARFGISPDSEMQFLRYGENTTFRVRTADGEMFALRLNRPGYHTLEGLRSELTWMAALRAAGIRTAVPVPGADGEQIQHAAHGPGETHTAMMFSWVAGLPLSSLGAAAPWERLGELMASVHAQARTWRRPPGFARPPWDTAAMVGDAPRWGDPDPDGVFSPEDRAAIDACRCEVARRLAAIGADASCYGLIHGDLSFENVLVEDGEPRVIDFDDCGESWFLHELAVALFPHEGEPGFQDARDALVRGYRRRGSLPDAVLAELPTFLMARRLCTLGWTFSRSDTEHAAAQRERRLRGTPAALSRFLAWARANPAV
jgi:Ser/Thr protein kinase RdoA (MazF antagonist)